MAEKTSFLGSIIQHKDVMETDGFVDYLFSELGRKELLRLNDKSIHDLWENIMSTPQDQQAPRKRTLMEYLLDIFPKSLTARRGRETVFHSALRLNALVPEDLLIRMVHTVTTNVFMGSPSQDIHGKANHFWEVAVDFLAPVNVLREIYNVGRAAGVVFENNTLFSSLCCKIGGESDIFKQVRMFEIIQFFLSIDPMLAKIYDDKNNCLPFHSYLDKWLSYSLFGHIDTDDDHTNELITIKCQIADVLYNANPLALETAMPNENYDERKNEMPLVRACRLGSNTFMQRTFGGGINGKMASSIIIYILKKCPEAVMIEDFSVESPTAGPSTALDFIQHEGLAEQVLSDIKGSEEVMMKLSTLRDPSNGNTIIHVLSNLLITCSAQLEHHRIIDGAARKMNEIVNAQQEPGNRHNAMNLFLGRMNLDTYRRIANTPRDLSKLIYHGLIGILPELTMVLNRNGDLALHVRLKAENTQDCLTDVTLLTNAYNKAKTLKVGDNGRNNGTMVSADDTETGTGIPSFVVAALYQGNPCVDTIYFLLRRYVGERKWT